MNGYIWCLVTDSPKPVRYFLFDHSRAGRVAAEFLGHFRGTLVTDFYSAYSKYDGVHQRCWVHLLRDLHELRQEHPDHEEILDWARGVDALYRLATEQLARWLEERARLVGDVMADVSLTFSSVAEERSNALTAEWKAESRIVPNVGLPAAIRRRVASMPWSTNTVA